MDVTLANGQTLKLSDDLSSDEIVASIKRVNAALAPKQQEQVVPVEQGSGDLWGPHDFAMSPQPMPTTNATPLPPGMAMTPTPEQLADQQGLEDPWIDPLLVAPGAGAIAGRMAYKAGVPLMQSAIRGLAGAGVAGGLEFPIGAATEQFPKKYQLPVNLALSVGLGGIENRVADKLADVAPAVAKFIGKKTTGLVAKALPKNRSVVGLKKGSEIADEVSPLLRSKIEHSQPKTNDEIFKGDDIPDFDAAKAKAVVEVDKLPSERKLFGQINKEADVRPTAGALGDNREKLAIKVESDKHLSAGRFGVAKLSDGQWRMYEKVGDTHNWVAGKLPSRGLAGDALAKVLELDTAGKKVSLTRIARGYARAARNEAKTRLGAEKKLVEEVKLGKDDYSVDMIEASEPMLKGVFGAAKTVNGSDVRAVVRAAWEESSLVTDGVADLGKFDRLARLDRLMDIVQGNPKAKGNIDEIGEEISRALRDGEITTESADLMRSLSRASRYPLSFGLKIAKRVGKDAPRASYNAIHRIMKLDPTKDGPFVYAHEFSHWGWWEVLSSSERLGAAKEIANLVQTGGIKAALPLAETAPGLLKSEIEIFAEMSSQFMLNNVLPQYMSKGITKAIARIAQAVKRVARRMRTNRTVSPELERMFRKIADAPDLKRQPKGMEDVYLPKGSLAKMSEEEAIEAMNKNEFLKTDPETGLTEVADVEKMDPTQRMLYADWVQNLGDHGLVPKQFGSVDEMLLSGQQALKPIIDPSMRQALKDKVGNDEMVAGLVNMSNDIAGKISQRVIKSGTRPIVKGPAEAAASLMEDTYTDGARGRPWWMGSVMQAKVAPTVMTGMVGGLEFDREDGVAIPFLGGRKLGWNPYKALAWAAVPGVMGGKTGLLGGALAKGTKGVTEKLWEKMEKNTPALYDFAASFHPTMRTPPDIYESLSDYLRIKPAIERQFNQQIMKLKNTFSNDELSLISDIIEQEGTAWMKAPQLLKDQAVEVQAWVKDIRDGLIDSGFPKAELDKLGDKYLPRVYGSKMKLKRPITTAESMWRSLYGDFLFKRGLPKSFDLKDPGIKDVLSAVDGVKGLRVDDKIYQFNRLGSDDAPTFVHQKQRQLLAKMRNMPEYHQAHEWEVERWNRRNMSLRRDYNRLERDMMGEKRNAAFRLSKFVKDAAHDTALGHAYQRVAANTEHVVDVGKIEDKTERVSTHANLIANGWSEVPKGAKLAGTDVEKYGALAGQMVSPEAFKIVKAMASHRYQSNVARAAHRMVSGSTRAWKIGKTAFNPATHGYNWVANLHMCALDGRDPISTLGGGIRSLMKKDAVYDRAIKAGMLDSNVLRGELDMSKFLQEIESVERGQVIDEGMGLLSSMAKFGKGKGRKAFYNALRTYEIGDEVFKLGVFRKELAKGATDTEAMAAANKLFFDYRDIPPGVANLRDWGVMPFVSYTYKALPVVAKSIRDYPHRTMGILWFYNMLNEAMYAADYGDKAKAQENFEREAMPEYMKDNRILPGGPQGNVRMSKRLMSKIGLGANPGQASFVDVAHGFPLGDMLSDSGIFGSYPFSFHPAISLLGGLITGKDPRFMKNIINEDPVTPQDSIDNAAARAKFIVRTLLPNLPFIPGQYSYEKIGNGLTAQGIIPPDVADSLGWTGKDQFGGEVSLPKEVFGMFGFLKFREPYPAEEALKQKKKIRGSVYKTKNKLKYGLQDARTSETELNKLYDNLDNTVDAQIDELGRLDNIAERAPDEDLLKYPQ